MSKKVAAIVALIVVASLLVAGCVNPLSTSSPTPTPTPAPTIATPTPQQDYSSYFDRRYEGGNAIMTRPFTKSTNQRGNDVYKGVARNATTPETNTWTIVIELTKPKAEAKQLYDQTVAQKTNEGYTIQPDPIANNKANSPYLTEVWAGRQSGSGQLFIVWYYYDSYSSSWIFETQSH